MQIGIDFGISYPAAAAYVQGRLEGIRFGEHALIWFVRFVAT